MIFSEETFLHLDPCWLPVQLILKHENNPNICWYLFTVWGWQAGLGVRLIPVSY